MRSIYSIIAHCYSFTNDSLTKLFYEMAIKVNDSYGYNGLGCIYYRTKNVSTAEQYFIKSANLNNTMSLYNLGRINDTNKDRAEAIKYYKMAIKCKCVKAMSELGDLYKSIGDYKEATTYYLIGIKNNCHKCMIAMAILCHMENNVEEERKYLLMASKQNNVGAMQYLLNTYSKSTDDEKYASKYAEQLVNHCDENLHKKRKYKSFYKTASHIIGSIALKRGKIEAKNYYLKTIKNNIDDGSKNFMMNLLMRYRELCEYEDIHDLEKLYILGHTNKLINPLVEVILCEMYEAYQSPISKAKICIYNTQTSRNISTYIIKCNKILDARTRQIEINNLHRRKYLRRLEIRYSKCISTTKNYIDECAILTAQAICIQVVNKKYDDKLHNINKTFLLTKLRHESTTALLLKNAHALLNRIPPYKLINQPYRDISLIFY